MVCTKTNFLQITIKVWSFWWYFGPTHWTYIHNIVLLYMYCTSSPSSLTGTYITQQTGPSFTVETSFRSIIYCLHHDFHTPAFVFLSTICFSTDYKHKYFEKAWVIFAITDTLKFEEYLKPTYYTWNLPRLPQTGITLFLKDKSATNYRKKNFSG